MYGLSTTTDLSPLVGSSLTFVGFGKHQLQLVFSGDADCLISVEADYTVARGGSPRATYREARAGADALLPLLDREVASAAVPSDGTVRLVFDDQSVIEVLDSNVDYESYSIHLGNDHLIV